MTLDSILAHIPAWREFFVDQWSAIVMTTPPLQVLVEAVEK